MRAPIVIAASVVGLVAGVAAASAADLPLESSGPDDCCYVEYGPVPLVILDDEPGVAMRRWWLPPWRNRHYYPHGGVALKAGGSKHSAWSRPRRAQSYARYWTNPPVYVLDSSPLLPGEAVPLPPPRVYRSSPPAVAAP